MATTLAAEWDQLLPWFTTLAVGGLGAILFTMVHGLLFSPAKKKIKMGYWGIRGLGAPMRMMLEYAGADYDDTKYSDPKEWFDKKKPVLQKKNALANLPYVEVGDTVVCESNACLAFLESQLGLSPADEASKMKDQELLSMCMCTRNDLTNRAYSFNGICKDRKTFDEAMTKVIEGGPFAKYEASLSLSGSPFFCGKAPCACDFHIFEMLDQYSKLAKDLKLGDPMAKLPLCAAFYKRFKALPSLQKYFASDSYKLACNAAMAHW